MHTFTKNYISSNILKIILGLFIFCSLIFISYKNYLLFHTLVEVFFIIVKISVFLIAWNTKKRAESSFLLFIGISFLFTGFIDLFHALSYEGMGIFEGSTVNMATQLWIVGRFLSSASFMAAFFYIKRKFNTFLVFLVFSLITLLFFIFIFYLRIFPDAFVEGYGLTDFKIISELIIIGIFLTILLLLYLKRASFYYVARRMIAIAIFIFIAAEIMFLFYKSPYGFPNMLGHIFRLIGIFFIYWTFIDIGLSKPFESLYRRLNKNRKTLGRKAKQLKSSNKDLESFTYSLSHDLRKELRIIDGHSAIMKSMLGKDSEQYSEHISKIRTSVLNISNIIDSFIRIYNITQSSLVFQKIDISGLANEIIQNKKEVYKDSIVECMVRENISIYSDTGLVKILFENLIDNAFKFLKNDSHDRIEIGAIEENKKNIVFVRDTGIGIDEVYHKKIYLPFAVFNDKKSSSTGIGLYIVKKVIDVLQGSIWFESEKDEGTVFYINIDRGLNEKENNSSDRR